ncbi:WD40 repeat domain-containing protein [Streptomyces sp. NPDC057620]|uniref:WD40 repeat domain-containing protein n=1 Tax=Streptomyces sp. NPDC057620 TaxID=3346185 RepID=UPI0036B3890C
MSDASDERQAAIHRQIAERLAELVPSDPALPPHPYLRRYLAEHAAQGHVLDDDHMPLALLAWESSSQVRRLLAAEAAESEPDESRWLQAWATLEPFARNVDPLSRLCSLSLARYAAAVPAQTRREERRTLPHLNSVPITPLWSDRVAPTPAWTAGSTEVTALALLERQRSRAALVAAGDDVGTLRLLRLDGRLVHLLLSLHSGAITHLLPLGGSLLITAGTDGHVVAVQVEENGQLTQQVITHRQHTWVSSLTTYHPHGSPRLLLAAFSDGTVEAFDIGRFQPQTLPLGKLTDSSALLCGIDTADAGPQLLLSMHDTVYRFDGTSTLPHSRHSGRVRALVALPELGQYAVGDEHSNVSLCDLRAESPVRTAPHDASLKGGTAMPVTSLQLVALAQPALVSAAGDGTLRLWKLPGLKAIPGMLQAHTTPVNAMTALPGRASDRLLSSGADRIVRSWTVDEATFGQEPKAWNRVTASAVCPTPPHRLAVARASRVIIKDLPDGAEITRFKGRRVSALAWPQVGERRILAAAVGYSIFCIDPETNQQASPEMSGHLLPIRTLVTAPSAGGDLLASAGADGTVCVWQPTTGQRLARFADHDITVRCLATHHSASHRLLASGGSDGNIRIWDVDTLQQHGPTIKCDQNIINDLAFVTPGDGEPLIAAAGQDGTLKLWDPHSRRATRTLNCHDGEISAVTSLRLPFGRTALAAAGKTSIHVWDVAASAQPLLQIITGSPVKTLKTVQDPNESGSSILLASGEAGSMAFRLHHGQL